MRQTPASSTIRRHVAAGLCASLIGIGLARFAYTPLIPPMIRARWFSANDVVYLGAANLGGYLLGAVLGRPIAARLTHVQTLRAMMVLVSASLLACAFPFSIGWFFAWRLISGVAGGVIMVLVAAAVLPHVPNDRRGLASGAIFLGIGVGIAASGTLLPLLLKVGLRETWIGLGVLSALLTAATWTGWPREELHRVAPPLARGRRDTRWSVALVYTQYALMAVGLVPPMVFLVDFIARGLGAGESVGSFFWILYGIGAILGPPVYGFIADRLGAQAAVRLLLLTQAAAVAGLAVVRRAFPIGLLAMIVGSFPPGIVPMTLARIREIHPDDATQQNIVWSRATIVFAAFQAIAAYAYSGLFAASGGNYQQLFAVGAGAISLALALGVLAPFLPGGRRAVAGR